MRQVLRETALAQLEKYVVQDVAHLTTRAIEIAAVYTDIPMFRAGTVCPPLAVTDDEIGSVYPRAPLSDQEVGRMGASNVNDPVNLTN